MQFPKEDSRRHKMLVEFIKHGGMSIDEFIDRFGMFGLKQRHKITSEFKMLMEMGCLRCVKDKYIPTAGAFDMDFKDKSITESKTPRNFVELSKKYQLPTVSPRGQEFREISFLVSGQSFGTK